MLVGGELKDSGTDRLGDELDIKDYNLEASIRTLIFYISLLVSSC